MKKDLDHEILEIIINNLKNNENFNVNKEDILKKYKISKKNFKSIDKKIEGINRGIIGAISDISYILMKIYNSRDIKNKKYIVDISDIKIKFDINSLLNILKNEKIDTEILFINLKRLEKNFESSLVFLIGYCFDEMCSGNSIEIFPNVLLYKKILRFSKNSIKNNRKNMNKRIINDYLDYIIALSEDIIETLNIEPIKDRTIKLDNNSINYIKIIPTYILDSVFSFSLSYHIIIENIDLLSNYFEDLSPKYILKRLFIRFKKKYEREIENIENKLGKNNINEYLNQLDIYQNKFIGINYIYRLIKNVKYIDEIYIKRIKESFYNYDEEHDDLIYKSILLSEKYINNCLKRQNKIYKDLHIR